MFYSFHFGLSGCAPALEESPMAPRLSWAKADNPFWSNHIAAWYRSALDAEHYCQKHDLSTASLMRWARYLLSAEDLRKHAEDLQKVRRKEPRPQPKNGHSNKRGLGAIATACVQRAVRLRFGRSGACMWRRRIGPVWGTPSMSQRARSFAACVAEWRD
jgi:hypothetical protein